MQVKIESPPIIKGQPEQQIGQITNYLFRLSEMLNVALNNLTVEGYTSAVTPTGTAQSTATAQPGIETAQSYNELKALINNTADIVRREMEVLETELNAQYEAISNEWGTYQEDITSTIEVKADEVVQKYSYDAAIETLEEEMAGFSAYQMHTEGYIRQGFIDYDENNVPIIGIAIGQGLTSTTVTIDDEEFEQFDSAQSCAFYTAEKVSFYIHGQEVAYISNRKLYIGDVEINGSVVLGGKWMLDATNGLKIRWIGGEA